MVVIAEAARLDTLLVFFKRPMAVRIDCKR